ncbi:MAG: polymer-forming cytoskeletal protein [Halopseudomonas sp.]
MSLVGKLHIDGLFEGRISSLDSITVGRRGQVSGVIRADQVSVSGRVEAEIYCDELTIERGGHVCGVVHSRHMTIHKQGSFIGERALTADSSLMSPQQLNQLHADSPPASLPTTRTAQGVIELTDASQDDGRDNQHRSEPLTQMLEEMLGEVPRVGSPRKQDSN